MEIIPAIDIINGKCVRLTKGDFGRQTVYDASPLETAKRFETAGFRRLHMVDLDGAKNGSPVNLATLEKVASDTGLIIDFGGGIKTDLNIESVFNSGAHMVNLGSIAVRHPKTLASWIERFSGERLLLAADVRDGKIATGGWQEDTGVDLLPFLRCWSDRGITQAFVTDVSRDGTMTGPNVDLYKQIADRVPKLRMVASGGVTTLEDLEKLKAVGCYGAIVGKAIYENSLTLDGLIEFQNAG